MVYEPVEAKAVAEEKTKPEVAAPQIVKAQETSTPQVNYTPIIILGIFGLVIVAICYFGYLASRR
jgi:type VI protein secretion system component VasF